MVHGTSVVPTWEMRGGFLKISCQPPVFMILLHVMGNAEGQKDMAPMVGDGRWQNEKNRDRIRRLQKVHR